jgi:hypothetical protein
MIGVDLQGRSVHVDKTRRRQTQTSNLIHWSDDQVRGLFARIGQAGGLSPKRTAEILRVSRPTLYRNLATEAPADLDQDLD